MKAEVIFHKLISTSSLDLASHPCEIESPKTVCATIVTDSGTTKKRRATPADMISDRITSNLYEKCRLKTCHIAGFPDFAPLVGELNEAAASGPTADQEFKVTAVHPSGCLVIQEQFYQKWDGEEAPAPDFRRLAAEHDEKFNAANVRLATPAAAATPAPPAENVKVELVEPGDTITQNTIASLPSPLCAQRFS